LWSDVYSSYMVSSNPELHYSELRVVQHTDISPDRPAFSRPFGRFSFHNLCRFCRNCSIFIPPQFTDLTFSPTAFFFLLDSSIPCVPYSSRRHLLDHNYSRVPIIRTERDRWVVGLPKMSDNPKNVILNGSTLYVITLFIYNYYTVLQVTYTGLLLQEVRFNQAN
jgi:hypothetical protein